MPAYSRASSCLATSQAGCLCHRRLCHCCFAHSPTFAVGWLTNPHKHMRVCHCCSAYEVSHMLLGGLQTLEHVMRVLLSVCERLMACGTLCFGPQQVRQCTVPQWGQILLRGNVSRRQHQPRTKFLAQGSHSTDARNFCLSDCLRSSRKQCSLGQDASAAYRLACPSSSTLLQPILRRSVHADRYKC